VNMKLCWFLKEKCFSTKQDRAVSLYELFYYIMERDGMRHVPLSGHNIEMNSCNHFSQYVP
jgi:hypothetical protein